MTLSKIYDIIMLILIILILILLFQVAFGIHVQASAYTGELPADLRI